MSFAASVSSVGFSASRAIDGRPRLGWSAIVGLVAVTACLFAPPRALAGPEDNIRADLLAVEVIGNQTIATLDYSVVDAFFPFPPFGFGNINPYTIHVGLDRDGDLAIDSLLWSFAGDTTGTVIFPSHTVSADLRLALDGLPPADRVQDGDQLVAVLDVNDDNPNEFFGAGEGDNVVAATPFYVDIRARTLVLNAANIATLTFWVNSPSKINRTTVEFWLDSDDSGNISGGDTLVTSFEIGGKPGIRRVTADFSGNVPETGQMIFARMDAFNDVEEAKEGNNTVSTTNSAGTDLVAASLAYDETSQQATFTYFVEAPTDVDPYNIEFILDNGNGLPDVGDTNVGSIAGDVTPGVHTTAPFSFAGNAPASGQFIFAFLDQPGAGGNPPISGLVIETIEEDNNWVGAANTFTTDIEAVALTYDSNTQTATFVYLVTSPTPVDAFGIRFGLDRDNSLDNTGDFPPVDVVPGDTTPGAHVVTQFYDPSLGDAPASDQMLYAIVDEADAIVEDNESNNQAQTTNTTPTDLVAISLAYDIGLLNATISYAVNAPIDVPAYNIEFYLDRNNTTLLDAGDGPAVAVQAGQVAPGAYTATASFAGDIPATNQFLFAVLDPMPPLPNSVLETDDSYASNVATTSNSQETDLVANSINIFTDDIANETSVRVVYTVYGPLPVASFSLKIGMDRDGDNVIDAGAGDVLDDVTISALSDLTPGMHVIDIANIRPALNGLPPGSKVKYGDRFLATLDLTQAGADEAAVAESEEVANNRVSVAAKVNLVANSIAVTTDPSVGSTKARVNYTVDSPAEVEPFTILVGVDRDNDGAIDTPGDVLDTIAVTVSAKLRPGPKGTSSNDFRAALNAISPPLQQGDQIIAMIDLLFDGTPVNDVAELAETADNVAKQVQKIDLVANAVSVNVDVLGGTTEADVAYTVDSPGSVADFSLKIGLDRDGDERIDNPDGLLSDQTLTGADLEPGAHTVTVTGLRAALNGLATPIKNGDAIVATLDLLLNNTDAGAVNEDIESTNNHVSQVQTVDLVANAVSLSSDDIAGTTAVDVAYTVSSPADAAAFDIRVGVDRNADSVIDADPSDLLATLAAPDLTPGSHTASLADIRPALEALATRLAEGDAVIATLDLDQAGVPINNVIEAEETANNVTGQAQTVDLVLADVSLYTTPAEERLARVSYTVSSVGTAASFVVRIGLDIDGNGVLDPGSVLRSYDVEPDVGVAGLRPGAHQITTDDLTVDLNALQLQNGYAVIATLDLADVDPYDLIAENNVAESEDIVNNHASRPLNVDLIAISLAFDSNTDLATFSYDVSSLGAVPAYDIEFYLDDNPENGAWDALDTLVDTEVGDTLPGPHTAVGNYAGTTVGSSQFIFAVIDRAGAVTESIETNNIAGTNNSAITDLVANSITVNPGNDDTNVTTAAVAYTIVAPDPDFIAPAFDILIGVDRDGNNAIDAAGDVLATIPAPDLTPGFHSATSGNLRSVLEGLTDRLDNGDRIVAMLDLTFDGTPVNNVVETGGDEIGNNVASQAIQVDLVATAVEFIDQPATGQIRARVSYTIYSPGRVDNFFIRVGVDRDGDKIIDPVSLLETIDVEALGPGRLDPGDRNVNTGDLTAALNALAVPLGNADRIIATLDILDDGAGTPENLVVEDDEVSNNFARTPITVDLVAQSIFLTVDNFAGTTTATTSYFVNSFGDTADFELRIGIDRDGDDVIDAGAGDLVFQATLTGADVLPGAHDFVTPDIRAVLNALSPPIKHGDRIIATLDLTLAGADEGAVDEQTEVGNNVTSAAGTQTQIIDLSADALNLNVGSFVATVDYTVTAPSNVAPFRVHIGRDTDSDDVIDDLLADLPGDPTPGAHQVSADVAAELLALGVAAGETVKIVAVVDAAGDVVELTEANNKLLGSAEYLVDLLLRRITNPCAVLDNTFDVTVEYAVYYNAFNEDFAVCVYASDDDDDTINPGDVLITCVNVTAAADKTVGEHNLTITGVVVSSSDFQANNFFVKVRLDDAAAVDESDEGNNALARPNAAMDPTEDADADGVPDCFDECDGDPDKTSPGACGCGVPDTDTDSDGVPNCFDNCDQDPLKLDPGICGCGVVDDPTDADFDGTVDCVDADPTNPDVPNPRPNPPEPQPIPGGGGFEVILPLFPAFPFPICGIGLCGSGAMVPIGVMLVGFAGLKLGIRRRRRR